MESKLLKIELNPGSRPHLEALIQFMQDNIEFPRNEMEQKGYYWDSVFIENIEGIDYLYVVIKSNDFSSIMRDEQGLIETPFREVYEAFRKQCWAPRPYVDITSIARFNSKVVFC